MLSEKSNKNVDLFCFINMCMYNRKLEERTTVNYKKTEIMVVRKETAQGLESSKYYEIIQ